MTVLTIDARFRGPTASGNGGYVAGRLAGDAEDPVTVTLHAPPPLGRPLTVVGLDDVTELRDGATVVADARPAHQAELTWVPAISPAEAAEAEKTYPGLVNHPFPQCFVCGTERAGDGLALRPGRITDGVSACTWTVADDVAERPEFVWAALDCPGGWAAPIEGRPMVLGTITAQVLSVPRPGERCVVMGRVTGSRGRKVYTETSVYGEGQRHLGRAAATWVVLPGARS